MGMGQSMSKHVKAHGIPVTVPVAVAFVGMFTSAQMGEANLIA